MADIEAVGKQFVTHYNSLFDTDRKQLAPLYRDNSMLTFEGQAFPGTAQIVQKLGSLDFQKVERHIETQDYQPSNGGMLVLTTGVLKIDGENEFGYTQTFQVMPDGGSLYISNEIFRLVFKPGQ